MIRMSITCKIVQVNELIDMFCYRKDGRPIFSLVHGRK